MARIRTIKPEFWQNETLASIKPESRLLAIALLNFADDEGYFKAAPNRVRAVCFPFSEDSVSTHVGLTELSRIGWIERRITPDGEVIGWIVKFSAHQRINRKTPSQMAAIFKDSAPFSESSVSPHQSVSESSMSPHTRNGMEWNGSERKKEGTADAKPEDPNALTSLEWGMADGSVQRLTDDEVESLRVMHPNVDIDFAVRQAWGHHRGLAQHEKPRSLQAVCNGWIANSRGTPQGRRNLQVHREVPVSQRTPIGGMTPEELAYFREQDRIDQEAADRKKVGQLRASQ